VSLLPTHEKALAPLPFTVCAKSDHLASGGGEVSLRVSALGLPIKFFPPRGGYCRERPVGGVSGTSPVENERERERSR
jgi:hypothetical protein